MEKLDAVILAGGYATRLAGLWDAPKCLVPVMGKPILQHLLTQLNELQVQKVVLLLGHKHTEVLDWFFTSKTYDEWKQRVIVVAEVEPAGTASALRMAAPALQDNTLVLNGDTFPRYKFSELIQAYEKRGTGLWLLPAMAAYNLATYAGACIFNRNTLDWIVGSRMPDLDFYLPNMQHHQVSGFLDVGTPAGFALAKTFTNNLP